MAHQWEIHHPYSLPSTLPTTAPWIGQNQLPYKLRSKEKLLTFGYKPFLNWKTTME